VQRVAVDHLGDDSLLEPHRECRSSGDRCHRSRCRRMP
jgi:hypothetical protein